MDISLTLREPLNKVANNVFALETYLVSISSALDRGDLAKAKERLNNLVEVLEITKQNLSAMKQILNY